MYHSANFLEQSEPEPIQRRHRGVHWLFAIAVVLVCLLLAVGLWTALLAGRIVSAAFDGRDHVERARVAAEDLDFTTASVELGIAAERFAAAEAGIEQLWYLDSVPWVSTQLEAGKAVLHAGSETLYVLEDIVSLGEEVLRLAGVIQESVTTVTEGVDLKLNFDELSPDTKRAVLARLAGAAPDLAVYATQVDLALQELDALPSVGVAAPIIEALREPRAQLEQFSEGLRAFSIAAVLLPEFAGVGQTKTILLLFQNNMELRPAGGFIGTYGVLRVEDGSILELTTRDVYHLDNAAAATWVAEPPAPLSAYNATTNWFFRDSNWSPDFAVAAQQAISAFTGEVRSIPEPTRSTVQPLITPDAVVAFTPDLASDLLRITGPITVSGQTFTAENVADLLEYQVEYGYVGQGLPPAQRKEIIADLVNEMRARLFAIPISGWGPIMAVVEESLRTKQLVLYSADQDAETILSESGWGGRMNPGAVDSLLVVDANLASLKSDPSVSRTITYSIDRADDGTWIGQTKITYAHHGTFDWKTTRYRTYTRVYVPDGSTLVRASGMLQNDRSLNPSGAEGDVDVTSELGFTVFGAFTSVEPGGVQELIFEYTLPTRVGDAIENGRYELRVLKQIGAAAHALTLDLNFGKKVASAAPAEDPAEWGDDIYFLNTFLDQDREVLVEL